MAPCPVHAYATPKTTLRKAGTLGASFVLFPKPFSMGFAVSGVAAIGGVYIHSRGKALKRKETADLVGPDGSVQTRLNLALDELRRAQQLASVGEYTNARAMLRKGNLESVRGDLVKVGAYLRVQRPTFDQFEALAVTGGLDAFDNAMRARQVGVAEVTDRDVAVNAKAAVAALEEVCYVLGKDKTYEEMKARLADPEPYE